MNVASHVGQGRRHVTRLAQWLGAIVLGLALPLPLGTIDARAAEPMAARMQACTPCHGAQGRATPQGYYPRIAGKPAGYLFNQLVNFRDGRRHNASMVYLVQTMSDAYLLEIAQYFAALELPYAAAGVAPAAADTMARGEQLVRHGDPARELPACQACHGSRLTGAEPALPGLVGLPRDYLAAQLGAWRTGQRRAHAPDCMSAVARRLSVDDIEAVTRWIAAQAPLADMRPDAVAPPSLPLACGSGVQ